MLVLLLVRVRISRVTGFMVSSTPKPSLHFSLIGKHGLSLVSSCMLQSSLTWPHPTSPILLFTPFATATATATNQTKRGSLVTAQSQSWGDLWVCLQPWGSLPTPPLSDLHHPITTIAPLASPSPSPTPLPAPSASLYPTTGSLHSSSQVLIFSSLGVVFTFPHLLKSPPPPLICFCLSDFVALV